MKFRRDLILGRWNGAVFRTWVAATKTLFLPAQSWNSFSGLTIYGRSNPRQTRAVMNRTAIPWLRLSV